MTPLVRQANQKGAFIGRLKLQAAFAALWVLYLEIQEEPWVFHALGQITGTSIICSAQKGTPHPSPFL